MKNNNIPLLPSTYLLPESDTSTSSHGITVECRGCYRPVSYRMSLENPPKTDGNQLFTNKILTSITNEKNQRLAKELKNTIASHLETTSGHGCPNLIRTKYWSVRIMWIILLFVASGASAYLVTRAIKSYLRYDVATKISTVKEIPTQFPTITICNLNPLIKGKKEFKKYLQSIKKTQFLDEEYLASQYEFEANNTEEYYDYYDEKAFKQNNNETTKSPLDVYKEIKLRFFNFVFTQLNEKTKRSLGYDLEHMLISCSFNKRECSAVDFNWHFSYEYGNCFSFNTGVNETNDERVKLKESKRAGEKRNKNKKWKILD